MNTFNKDKINMDDETENVSSRQIYIRLINKTEDYIENNLKEVISLKDLARNAHLSEFHFHRIFKKYSF